MDFLEHAIEVLKHIVVPEPQDAEALCLQPSRARGVLRCAFCVLSAIHFNDEPRVKADEVGDVRPRRHLPSETVAVDLLVPQPRPKPRLGIGGIAPKLPGNTD